MAYSTLPIPSYVLDPALQKRLSEAQYLKGIYKDQGKALKERAIGQRLGDIQSDEVLKGIAADKALDALGEGRH